MISFFQSYFHMAIAASLVILVILAIRPLFKRFSNRIACFLWVVVAFRLIFPFQLERPAFLDSFGGMVDVNSIVENLISGVSLGAADSNKVSDPMGGTKGQSDVVAGAEAGRGAEHTYVIAGAEAGRGAEHTNVVTSAEAGRMDSVTGGIAGRTNVVAGQVDSEAGGMAGRTNVVAGSKMDQGAEHTNAVAGPEVGRGVERADTESGRVDAEASRVGKAADGMAEHTNAVADPETGLEAGSTAFAADVNVEQADGFSGKETVTILLGCVWILGMVVFLLGGTQKYRCMSRKLDRAVFWKNWDRYPVKLCRVKGVPMSFGVLHPTIYVPAFFGKNDSCGETGFSDNWQEMILWHEEMHLKHHDTLWKVMAFLILSVHWWNPLVWVAVRCMNQDLEMACDERVLKTIGQEKRQDYAITLYKFATDNDGVTLAAAFGESHAAKRIKNVIRYKKTPIWITSVLLVGVLFLGGCLATVENASVARIPVENDSTETISGNDIPETHKEFMMGSNALEFGSEISDRISEIDNEIKDNMESEENLLRSKYKSLYDMEYIAGIESENVAILNKEYLDEPYLESYLLIDGELHLLDIRVSGNYYSAYRCLKSGDFDADGKIEYAYLEETTWDYGPLYVFETNHESIETREYSAESLLDEIKELESVQPLISQREVYTYSWKLGSCDENGLEFETVLKEGYEDDNGCWNSLDVADISGKIEYKQDGRFQLEISDVLVRDKFLKQEKLESYSVQELRNVTKYYSKDDERDFSADDMSIDDVRILFEKPEDDVYIYGVYSPEGMASVFRAGDCVIHDELRGWSEEQKQYFLLDKLGDGMEYALIRDEDTQSYISFYDIDHEHCMVDYDFECFKKTENVEQDIALYYYSRIRSTSGYILRDGQQCYIGDPWTMHLIPDGMSSEDIENISIVKNDYDGDGRTEYAILLDQKKLGIMETYEWCDKRRGMSLNWCDYDKVSEQFETEYYYFVEDGKLCYRFDLYDPEGKKANSFQGNIEYNNGVFEVKTTKECEMVLNMDDPLKESEFQQIFKSVTAQDLRNVTVHYTDQEDYQGKYDLYCDEQEAKRDSLSYGDFIILAEDKEEDAAIYNCYGYGDGYILRVKDQLWKLNKGYSGGDCHHYLIAGDYDKDGKKEFAFYTRRVDAELLDYNVLIIIDIDGDEIHEVTFLPTSYDEVIRTMIPKTSYISYYQQVFEVINGEISCTLLLIPWDDQQLQWLYADPLDVKAKIEYSADGVMNLDHMIWEEHKW